MNNWQIIVRCTNPICYREIGPVPALDPEQARLIATKKANELFGKEEWDSMQIYIINATYPNTKT